MSRFYFVTNYIQRKVQVCQTGLRRVREEANVPQLIHTERYLNVAGVEAAVARSRGKMKTQYAGPVVDNLVAAEADIGQHITTIAGEGISRACYLLEGGTIGTVGPVT